MLSSKMQKFRALLIGADFSSRQTELSSGWAAEVAFTTGLTTQRSRTAGSYKDFTPKYN